MHGGDLFLLWARGALLAALGGHWLGNLLLDEGRYVDEGLSHAAPASLPILVQSIVVAAIVLLLRPQVLHASPRIQLAVQRLTPARAVAWLIAVQVGLFIFLEGSERIAHGEAFSGGTFSSGFFVELALALAIALVLTAIGMVAARAIGAPRRRRPTSQHPIVHVTNPDAGVRHRAAQVPAGGVRGPPVLLVFV